MKRVVNYLIDHFEKERSRARKVQHVRRYETFRNHLTITPALSCLPYPRMNGPRIARSVLAAYFKKAKGSGEIKRKQEVCWQPLCEGYIKDAEHCFKNTITGIRGIETTLPITINFHHCSQKCFLSEANATV